jgi:Subtilase family
LHIASLVGSLTETGIGSFFLENTMSTRHFLLRQVALTTAIIASLTTFSASAQTAQKSAEAGASLSAAASTKGGAISGIHPKLDSMLGGMAKNELGSDRKSLSAATPSSMLVNGMISIVAMAQPGQVAQLRVRAEALGMKNITVAENTVYGQLPPAAAARLGELSTLNFARMAGPITTDVGSVTSQGDRVMKSDAARMRTNLNGAGVKVGVISDSYNTLNTADTGVTSGNLPGTGNPNGFSKPVQVVKESDAPATDEGRAMAEIVHDVAPGAEILFHTAFGNGEAGFADAVRTLAKQGATVIVDDVGFGFTPSFQDGLGARAVDEVVAAGVTYFTSAGNAARRAYASQAFPGLPVALTDPDGVTIGTYRPHQFISNDGNVSSFLKISVRKVREGRQGFFTAVQWSQPWATLKEGSQGSKTDWDVFLFDQPDFATLVRGDIASEFGRDAISGPFLETELPVGTVITGYVAIMAPITRDANPFEPGQDNTFAVLDALRLTVVGNGYQLVETDAEPSGTIVGHKNTASAISMCAAQYDAIDAEGRFVAQDFTSVGGVKIRIGKNERRTFEDRQKPDLCGPDGGNTPFFAPFGANDFDNDGFPNFNGTSASAPHAAAVGALMKEARPDLRPNQIRQILKNTARDMKDPYSPFSPFDRGQDATTGAGFIDADRALRSLGR